MATDIALMLDGIPGECRREHHDGEIAVASIRFGASQSGVSTDPSGMATTGVADVRNLTIEKYLDKASPVLFFNCVSGTVIPNGVLTVRHQGGQSERMLVLTLTQVLITSVDTGGCETDNKIKETITLSFETIEHSYYPQEGTGGEGAPTIQGWDIPGNTKL